MEETYAQEANSWLTNQDFFELLELRISMSCSHGPISEIFLTHIHQVHTFNIFFQYQLENNLQT